MASVFNSWKLKVKVPESSWKVKVPESARRVFLSPLTPCSVSGIVAAFYIKFKTLTINTIHKFTLLFIKGWNAWKRYENGKSEKIWKWQIWKDMKMVNLKMSHIAALPPLCYGHSCPGSTSLSLAIRVRNTNTNTIKNADTKTNTNIIRLNHRCLWRLLPRFHLIGQKYFWQ